MKFRPKRHHRILVALVLPEQTARASGHAVHRAAQAGAHPAPLVPPRHRPHLLLAQLQGPPVYGPLVQHHELPRPLTHVHLLRLQSHALQDTALRQPGL